MQRQNISIYLSAEEMKKVQIMQNYESNFVRKASRSDVIAQAINHYFKSEGYIKKDIVNADN